MKINAKDFRVQKKIPVNLDKYPTLVSPFYDDKEDYQAILDKHTVELSHQQNLLYASGQYAILILFQAMDAGGKDGLIRHVMSGVNPQGCKVASFKSPSNEETRHDFLWRINRQLPERGQIGIFNRSYYEDVLIARVHPEILKEQHLPSPWDKGHELWKGRYRSIRDMEAHLHRNGTRILKFFLHISENEQKKRLIERIDTPEKNWKFSMNDLHERQYWDSYMKAYENAITHTASKEAPWYIIPADDKENARIIVSDIILKTLKHLKLSWPRPDKTHEEMLMTIREKLQFMP